MDEYTIVEATETPVRSTGDGFPRRTPQMEKVKEDETEDGDGPWQETDLGKRHKQALDSGYLTDLTVIVINTKFRCHKIILSFSSPKLAKMIIKNPNTLQLQNMDPRHFRFLLEIIYGEEADELNNAKDALEVARVAKELHVYTAIAYCTKILGKLLDPKSVYEIMDFACLNNDGALKDSCIKVIQEHTKEILASSAFLTCSIETLKLILSQEVLQATELDLFLACARWAKKHENRRQALGSALGLIGFRLLTADEFIQHVKPTQLLTDKEENAFFMCFHTKDGKMPEGFSNEMKKRNMFLGKDETRKIGAEEEIKILDFYVDRKCVTTEESNKTPPLRFSVTGDVNLIGIKVCSYRYGGSKYMEDVTITLRDENETVITSATYCDVVKCRTYYTIKFSSPVPMHANLVYRLCFKYNVAREEYCVWKRKQQTLETKTHLEIKILNEAWSSIWSLIIAPYV